MRVPVFVTGRAALLSGEGGAASARGRGVRILDGEAAAGDRVHKIDLGTLQIANTDRIHEQLDAIRFKHLIAFAAVFFDHQTVLKARASSTLYEDAEPAVLLLLFSQELANL